MTSTASSSTSSVWTCHECTRKTDHRCAQCTFPTCLTHLTGGLCCDCLTIIHEETDLSTSITTTTATTTKLCYHHQCPLLTTVECDRCHRFICEKHSLFWSGGIHCYQCITLSIGLWTQEHSGWSDTCPLCHHDHYTIDHCKECGVSVCATHAIHDHESIYCPTCGRSELRKQ